ncbi:MAG TPA: hydroxyacid dehydrogenase, partial [Lachnospiraceae bacterium]|nr:hydroxyacid dehydrogenase [Lachnospiraceae bacterium]
KDERLQGQTINIKYNENTNRLRIILWANIDMTKEFLDDIAMLVEVNEMEE